MSASKETVTICRSAILLWILDNHCEDTTKCEDGVKRLVRLYINMDESIVDLNEKITYRIGDTTDFCAKEWLREHKGIERDNEQALTWMHAEKI